MAGDWYQAYLEAQKKEKQRKAEGKIYFAQDSKANRVQYTLPQYQGQSEKKNYKWETEQLKNVKGMGRSYNDKFSNITKQMGMSNTQAKEYRRYLDFEEDRKQEYKLNEDGTVNKSQSVRPGQGAMLQSELIDDIFKNMNQRVSKSFQENKKKQLEKEKSVQKKAKKEANPTVLDNLKNFLSSKDTNKDGQRDGLLGALDRFVLPVSQGATEFLAPGNNERMIQNDIEKDGKLTNPVNKASLVDRGIETKVLKGAGTLLAALAPYGEAYKAADYGFNKLPKLAKAVTNPYAQKAIKGAAAGGMAEAGLSAENELFNSKANNMKDYAIRTGLGVAGGAILDPALYGVGQGLKKGVESTVNNTMKNILPDKKEAAKRLSQLIKEYHSEQAPLPGKPDLRGAKELIPSGNSITDPNFVPSLEPKVNTNPVVPKIGNRLENIPPIEDLSLAERTQLVEGNRPTPDFSTAKPVIEPAEKVNVYGVEAPKGDLVDTAPPEYWQKRYEEFTKYVKDNGYTENNLNHEVIQELWTHFAKADEPPLSTVVDLAYKGYKEPKVINTSEVWDQMGNRPPVSKNAKDILFGNLKSKQNPLSPLHDLLPKLNPKQKLPTHDLLPKIKPKQEQTNPNLLETLKSLGELKNPKEVKTGGIPKLEDVLPKLPKTSSNSLKERGHIETLRQSDNATESLKRRIQGLYKPTSNEDAVIIANKYLAQGTETATSFVKSAKVLKPEHVATAHRLIQEFQRSGQIEKAVDIAEHIAERGTKAGQAVQAFSIFDKLSPEGILIHAKRVADRVNAKLNPLQQKVTITTDTAAQLTDLATTVQKMTQQKSVANDVINLMDRAKAGEKLTTEETKALRQFVDDAKQWIADVTPKKTKPKAPNKIINPAVKENVVKFLDSQEEAARKRLAARKNRALSGLPVDDFYDYTVIGAAKLAKGTINFAEFSEQMIREFGQEVAPHVQQIYDKASEMVSNEVKRTVNRLSEVEKITNKALKNGKLEATDVENLRKFALSINTMSGDAKIEASQELQAVLQGLERPSFLQQVSATQTIGQLLNPKTLGRNALGNEMFYRLERVNKLVATPIDWTRVAVFGGKRTVTFRTNNQAEYWKNWLKGGKAGLKGVNPEGLATQYDLRPNSFNGKWNPLKYLERTLGASLKSFDYAGYKRGVNNTIGELATLRAINEGLKGQAKKEAIARYIREVDENVLAIADQYGKYVTFQDNNIIAVGLQKFKRGLNFGKEFGAGDLIIKYPKTPGALLARALEYSPAGFLKFANELAKPFFNKTFVAKDATEALTRALIGTAGTTGIAWFLADKGILTGSGSKDFDVKELEKSAGKAEYSLNIDALKRWVFNGFNPKEAEFQTGDKLISYNWAQPIAMSMAIGANANNNVKTSGNPSVGVAAWEAGNGALDSLVGMSVLQGVQKAFTSYPGQSVGDKMTDIAGQLPASFVPTFSNQVRQKADNTARNVYDPLKLKQFNNQAKNKIPVLASKLPVGYDTLGNKKEVYKDKSNTFFNVFLNPAFVSRYNPSPEAEMVLNVIRDTGDESLAPRRAQKYLQIDGKRYDLTPQQYTEYQRRLGTEVSTQLQELDSSLTSEELGAKISKILDAAGRKVRKELKEEYGG